jgi:hypothetical protein
MAARPSTGDARILPALSVVPPDAQTTSVEASGIPTHMAMNVEIELRIPSLTVKADDGLKKINNALRRFKKVIEVPAFPQPGSTLKLSTASGVVFECVVVRADWHHEKDLFVLSCRWSAKKMSLVDYDALLSDTQWAQRELPA